MAEYLKKVVLLSVCAAFFPFYIVLVACLMILLHAAIETDNFSGEAHDFKFICINPSKNESNFGLISVPYDSSQFYDDDDGSYFLVSRFGEHEYQCFGSCVCDDNNIETRRLTATTVSRSLYFLVGAVTSFVAFQKAKEFFANDCVKKLSDSCDLSSIKSETDSCEKIVNDEEEQEVDKEVDYLTRKYICKGRCTVKKFNTERFARMARDFGCDSMITEGEVVLVGKEYAKRLSWTSVTQFAKFKFNQQHLKPFCKKQSKKEVEVHYGRKTYGAKRTQYRYFCRTDYSYRTIQCLQTYPKKSNDKLFNRKFFKVT